MARAAIEARYAWIDRKVAPLLDLPATAESRSDRIDRVVTHPVAGPLLFLATMGLLFQLMFVGADPLISRIEGAFGVLGGWLSEALPPGPLNDLLVNGIVAGVGSVVVFLPQIAILFALLAFLDGCGYLARAAFLMDRVMARVGLHGKSFVPMLSSFACAIPGIASTRTIERENDRFITILVAPLMTCSARLPVYALLLATFFSDRPAIGGVINQAALGLFLLYFLGTAGALAMAWLLRKTLLPGSRPPLILELPPYRLPRARDVWYEVRERCIGFAKDAGTVILATTILLWAAMTYPRSPEVEARFDAQLSALHEAAPADDAPIAGVEAHRVQVLRLQQERHQAVTERTVAGRVGNFILPVLEPLGFNEQISIGIIASLAAREVLVSSLGVSYGVGDDEESQGLRMALRNDPRMNRATAISILVWFVFAFQCFATAGAVRRETHSWKWPALLVGYQTVLAWVAAFVAYRGALWLGLGGP
jgi:ferrous iron transport protein B